jgi:hypothetical protein
MHRAQSAAARAKMHAHYAELYAACAMRGSHHRQVLSVLVCTVLQCMHTLSAVTTATLNTQRWYLDLLHSSCGAASNDTDTAATSPTATTTAAALADQVVH